MEPYPESPSMFTQLPRELQRETFMRMSYEDIETICISKSPPRVCFSEEFWKNKLLYDHPHDRGDDDEIDYRIEIVCTILSIVVQNIMKETSKTGRTINHYMVIEETIPHTVIYSAPDIRGALAKIYDDEDMFTIYYNAIREYIVNVPSTKTFSFKELVNSVLTYLVKNPHAKTRVVKVVIK